MACPIDEWRRRQPDLPSRSEAIRRLVELGLKVKSKWQDRLEFYRLVRLAELFLASFSTKGRLSPATEARSWNDIREFDSSRKDTHWDGESWRGIGNPLGYVHRRQ